MTTLLGPVIYERAYYHCPHCHHGDCPTDAEFGILTKKTPGVHELTSLVGGTKAFEGRSHEHLLRLTGISLSNSTIRRTTEAVGADVAQRRAAGETFGVSEPIAWHRDAQGKTTAYMAGDATGVPHGERGRDLQSRCEPAAKQSTATCRPTTSCGCGSRVGRGCRTKLRAGRGCGTARGGPAGFRKQAEC